MSRNLTVAAEGIVAKDAALSAVLATSTVRTTASLSWKKLVARNLGDLLLSHSWGSRGNGDDRGDSEEDSGELHDCGDGLMC